MSEIPSTMDLIMARTRGMTLSPEEQDNLRKEQLGRLAKGYRMKLLGDPERVDELLASVSADTPADRKLLEWLIWQEMVENLPGDVDIIKHIQLMEKFPEVGTRATVLRELRAAFKAHLKNQGPARKRILIQEKKKLAAIGISGSAVVPKAPRNVSPDGEFAAALATFKKRLLSDPPGQGL